MSFSSPAPVNLGATDHGQAQHLVVGLPDDPQSLTTLQFTASVLHAAHGRLDEGHCNHLGTCRHGRVYHQAVTAGPCGAEPDSHHHEHLLECSCPNSPTVHVRALVMACDCVAISQEALVREETESSTGAPPITQTATVLNSNSHRKTINNVQTHIETPCCWSGSCPVLSTRQGYVLRINTAACLEIASPTHMLCSMARIIQICICLSY